MAGFGGRARTGGGLAIALLCLAPAAAPAATVQSWSAGQMQYEAGAGESNRATFSVEDGRLTVSDPGAEIQAIAPCEPDGSHRASCPGTPNSLVARLGDGDDFASALLPADGDAASWISLTGGPGADELTAAGRVPYVLGGSDDPAADDGGDRISLPLGGSAAGGAGDDVIVADGMASLFAGPGDDRITGHDGEMEPGQCPIGMVCVEPPDPCRSARGRNDTIDAGPGRDVVEGRGGADVIVGGEGDDRIDGGAGCDELLADQGVAEGSWQPWDDRATAQVNGGPGGDDVVTGGPGDDAVAGGPGDDALDGGTGSDRIDPGSGTDVASGGGTGARGYDTASYSWRTQPLALSLDGLPNDGEAGEADLILATEVLIGGSGPDLLLGDSRSTPNPISGGFGGGNNLVGRGGDDTIVGGGGYHDVLDGGDGSDRIHALDGDPEGRGAVLDIPGMNKFAWDDRVECDGYDMPGRPAVHGRDLVVVDPGDNSFPAGVLRGCETVLHAQTPVTLRGGATSVAVGAICPAGPVAASCIGDVEIRLADAPPAAPALSAARVKKPRIPLIGPKSRRLASAEFKARPQRKRTVRVKLSSKTRRYVRERGKVRAYVVFRYRAKKR